MTSCAKLSSLLYIKLKIAIQVPKTYIYTPSFVFYPQPLWLLNKVRKSVYNTEMHFKHLFTCLERNSTFITSIFRTIYRNSSPEVFSKKDVLLQICSIFTEEYSWSHTFAWMFTSKLSKSFVEHLSWKTPLGDCFCIYESECSVCMPAFTCSELK